MVPSGRKQRRNSRKTSAEDRGVRACDLKKEDKKDLGGAEEEGADEKTPAADTHEKKRSAAGIVEHMGGDVQNMLERFGANINNALFAKRKRLVIHAKSSFKTSNQKIEHVLKTQQEQRKKLNQEYSEQFKTLFQQWETEMEKTEEQGKTLASLYEQQQKIFQQSRIVQSQRLKTIRQLCEQYMKSIEDLEEKNGNLITGAQNELRNEMAMLQKKIMMETQEEEMATVRKSLQSMVFW